jgi:hypothetical protein
MWLLFAVIHPCQQAIAFWQGGRFIPQPLKQIRFEVSRARKIILKTAVARAQTRKGRNTLLQKSKVRPKEGRSPSAGLGNPAAGSRSVHKFERGDFHAAFR